MDCVTRKDIFETYASLQFRPSWQPMNSKWNVHEVSQSQNIQSNLNSSNTDGSFIMANSNSFFSPKEILPIAQETRKQIFKDIFLFYIEIVWCAFSLESPHRGDSKEYTQHTIISRRSKQNLNHRHLLPDLASWLINVKKDCLWK